MFWQHNSPNIIQTMLELCLRLKRTFISLSRSARAYFDSKCFPILEDKQITGRRRRYRAEYFIPSVDKISTYTQFTSCTYCDPINALSFVRTSDIRTLIPCVLAAVLRAISATTRALKCLLTLFTDDYWHITFDSSTAHMVA